MGALLLCRVRGEACRGVLFTVRVCGRAHGLLERGCSGCAGAARLHVCLCSDGMPARRQALGHVQPALWGTCIW